jgi:hypothetical protein
VSALERRLTQQQDRDFLKVASVLFNTFIFAQVNKKKSKVVS